MRSLLSRACNALLLLWIVTTLTFVLIHLAPGDPASLLIAPTATPTELSRLRERFGLDQSLTWQYAKWMWDLLHGDLGTSIAMQRPVTELLAQALPVSLLLGSISLAASFVFGVALGGVQALRVASPVDAAITVLSTALYSAPSFWLALALVALATSGASAVDAPAWARLPAFGMHEPAGLATGFTALRDLARHAVLPLLVLSLPGAAGVARYARAALVDAAEQPHVQAAQARGVGDRSVGVRYVLRNAWTPLVVLLGLSIPGLIAGSVFVEQIFAWPGMGRTMLTAINARDYPVVLGLALVYAAAVIGANAVTDVVVLRLDARRTA